MKVLLIGGGAREHAIATALKRGGAKLYSFMGCRNPGIMRISERYKIAKESEIEKIVEFAKENNVDFAIAGPELPLSLGVADELEKAGIECVGPKRELAKIEASKAFARELMDKYKIDGLVRYGVFYDYKEAWEFIEELGDVAVKPIGLTGGKGVKITGEQLKDVDEAKAYAKEVIEKKIGGFAGVVIEERVLGEEFTAQVFVDGKRVVPMPAVQDFKRAYEGDKGHNTGGMGSYSCSTHLLPFLTKKDYEKAVEIAKKAVEALKKETGLEYKGILYAQCMLSDDVKLIEFNCRFGDPEAMNVLTILKSNFVEICESIIDGNLKKAEFEEKATVCKYIAPVGYGLKPKANAEITVDEEAIEKSGAVLYYAAVNAENNKLYTTTSRTLALVGVAESLREAEKIAEDATKYVRGNDIYHRRDIGKEELIKNKVERIMKIRGIEDASHLSLRC